jgi:hypothetical protein
MKTRKLTIQPTATMVIVGGILTVSIGMCLGMTLMFIMLAPTQTPSVTPTPIVEIPTLTPSVTPTPIVEIPTLTPSVTPTPIVEIPTLTTSLTATFPPLPSPTQVVLPSPRADYLGYSLFVNFKSNTYRPGDNQLLDVNVSIWETVTNEVRICAKISELRKYKNGQQKNVLLNEDCRTTYLKTEMLENGTSQSSVSVSFSYIPSGYSYVWTTSNDEVYQIIHVEAQVMLYEGERLLKTKSASHKFLPISVTDIGHTNNQAYATVQFLADNPEQQFNLKLVVTQVELDMDEAIFGIFLGCALESLLCYDVQEVASTIVPITLQSGKQEKITIPYSSKPVAEEGNSIWGYEVALYFEDVFVIRKK